MSNFLAKSHKKVLRKRKQTKIAFTVCFSYYMLRNRQYQSMISEVRKVTTFDWVKDQKEREGFWSARKFLYLDLCAGYTRVFSF